MVLEGHDEVLCHAVAESRHVMVKQLSALLNQLETEDDCLTANLEEGEKKEEEDVKALSSYPTYWLKALSKPEIVPRPLITSCNVYETRVVSEKSKLEEDSACTKTVLAPIEEFHRVPPWKSRQKSMELRGGRIYVGCDCIKYNGIQDRCQRKECVKSEDCLHRPYPLCPPSKTYAMYERYRTPTTRETQTPCCECCFEKEYVPTGEFKLVGCNCTCHLPPQSSHVSW